MENLIYSLNGTVPIFGVMMLGWILKKKGMLTENFVSVTNKYVFNVALPVMVFMDLMKAQITKDMNWGFVLFCFVSTVLCFIVIWAGAELFIKDKTMIGSFVQGSFRSSAAVLGLAFVQNIYHSVGVTPLVLVGAVPFYNVGSVVVLTFRGKEQNMDKSGIKKAVVKIVKNPIIIAIVLGCIASFCNIHEFPAMIQKSLMMVSNTATPMALIAIGAGFHFHKAMEKIGVTVWATVIKLVAQPMIFLPVAIAVGYRNEVLLAILIMLAGPATISGYIMAKNMKNDDVLSSGIIVLSTLVSSGTLTIWIYILKSLGYLV